MSGIKVMRLSEVCHVYQPETISKKSLPLDGTYPVYGANGKIGLNDKFNHEESQLLLGCRGSVGSVHISEPFSWINGNAMVVQPFEELVIRDYLKYALLGGINIRSAVSGTAQPQITRESLSPIKIPVPSLEEQHEIVRKLDNAFAEIDLLQENNLNAVKLNSLLLYAKINTELGAISKKESVKTLGEFGKISYGYTAKSSISFNGPKYLRITDIQEKSVNWHEVPNCEISKEEKSKFLLNPGDIVFARTGATTGKSFLIEEEVDAVFASYLIRIRPRIEILNPEFLYYFFQSSYYWDEIAGGISGSAQGGFNASKLQAMRVRFPTDIESQTGIVKRIRDFEIELNVRSNQLSKQALQICNLRESILNQAFTQERVLA
jgi:type I restriction enzyme S subunit